MVSFAPMAGAVGVTVSISALAIAALGVISGDAKAQTCTAVSESGTTTVNCTGSGNKTTTESHSAGNDKLDVSIHSGMGFDVASGNALTLSADGGIVLTQSGTGDTIKTTSGAAIRAYADGSSEDTSITLLGSVEGGTHGIQAIIQGDSSTGGITINAKQVTSTGASIGHAAILASAYGSNAISVTATGNVEGGHRGIFVESYDRDAAIHPITINAAAVKGAQNGIFVLATNAGPVAITATGHVQATSEAANSAGIYAFRKTGSITVSAATVTGTRYGISTKNGASAIGDTSITASQTVTASHTDGVGIRGFVGQQNAAASVTIAAATVSGGKRGIDADVRGSGSVSVTATGAVTGTSEFGIFAVVRDTSGGEIDITTSGQVSGGASGIRARNWGSEGITISAADTVTGTSSSGIGIRVQTAGGDISVNAATVTGSVAGITAINDGSGALTINATGAVTATGSSTGVGIDALSSAGFLTVSAAAAVAGSAHGIKAISSGTDGLTISAAGTVRVTGTDSGGIGIDAKSTAGLLTIDAATVTGNGYGIKAAGSAGITIKQSETGEIKASLRAIEAINSGGAISINVTGTVTQLSASSYITNRDAIYAKNAGGATGDLTITAGDTSSQKYAIRAVNEGTGATNITVIGSTTIRQGYSSPNFAGIRVDNDPSTSGISITMRKKPGAGDDAVSIDTTEAGIIARNNGTGPMSITVDGRIVGTSSTRRAVDARAATSAGDITISLNGRVNTGDGINVQHAGTGDVSITVGEFRGVGAGNRFNAMGGIHVETGGDISITASGHVDGAGPGIDNMSIWTKSTSSKDVTVTLNSGAVLDRGVRDGAGNASVTINAGATVREGVRLEGGDDWVHLAGGTISAGSIDAGTGNDTLRIASGSVRGGMSGWETVTVESGAQLTVLGSASATALEVSGALHFSGTTGNFAVAGNFTGGGTITLGANLLNATPTHDSLTITGNVTGVTDLNLYQVGTAGAGGITRPRRLDLITVQGTVQATAFRFTTIREEDITFSLERDTSNNQTVFYLKGVTNECKEPFEGSGVFTCSGTRVVSLTQELSASGNTELTVTLHPETPVTVASEDAFSLTQPGPADIVLVQLAGGLPISAGGRGIVAHNTSGGGISINVNGSVTGASGDGIRASNDTSGTGIAIIAASVYGSESGIAAIGSGTQGVSVTANGTVVGTADYGIYARTGLSGTGLTVSAGTVTGGKTGIKAVGSGTGGLSVIATGAVVGTANHGIHAMTRSSGTGLTVLAGSVTGAMTGITAMSNGTGALSVTATGAVVGAADYGIHAMTGPSGTNLTVAAGSVTGGKTGIRAVGSGTGSLSVTATGAVVGTADYGIHATTESSGAGLTVAAGSVTGGKIGIKVVGSGSGAVSVAATGNVTGTTTAGVMVSGGTSTGDMTVRVASVTGASGIDARQTGKGGLNIAATGTVTGTSGIGIYGLAVSEAGTLTITAAAVSGQGRGIKIVGSGANDVNVNASAEVSATGANAIGLEAMTSGAGGMMITTASVTGVMHGIKIENSGSGAARISASGSVTASADDGVGIDAVAEATAGAMTISAASVMAKQGGIKVVASGGGNTTINVNGPVRVEGHSSSGGWGVDALASGDGNLSITLGSVTADVFAVKAVSSGAGSVSVSAKYARTSRDSGNNLKAVWASGGSETKGVTVAVGTAYSSGIGIDAQHAGTGDLRVVATGAVTGKNMSAIKAVGSNKANMIIHAEKLVRSAGGDGIDASVAGSGDLAVNVASVTGNNYGIKAENTGTGGVSIDASGTVTAVASDQQSNAFSEVGIWARASGAGALRIAAATVTGDKIGIEAKSDGSGTVSVVSTGSVVGSSVAGIKVTGGTSTASVSVTAASVTSSAGVGIDAQQAGTGALTVTANETVSGTWGIKAVGSGDGAVSVTATGTVTGTSEHGIEAKGMKAVSVSAVSVDGKKNGIRAESEGSGSVSVIATGSVTSGDSHDGIHAIGMNGGITVVAATVTGEKSGIIAKSMGGGLVSVSASETVTGKSEHGIEARSNGGGVTVEAAAVSAAGAGNGILAVNDGTGSVRVVASGSVTATADSGLHGVHAMNSASGAAITIETRNAVMAKKAAIFADNSGGEVNATSSAAVMGGEYGVMVKAVSGIDLSLNGVIGESKTGVHAANSESGDVVIAMRGAVEGRQSGSHGVHAVNMGSQSGVMSIRGESAATISGTQSGVVANNMGTGLLTIDLSGAVTGEAGHGIQATNSGAGITIRAGSASGAQHGIFAEAKGAGGELRIDATGSVTGAGSDHDGIRAINSGSGQTRILVSGSAIGEKSGIHAQNTYSYASAMHVDVARAGFVSGKVDGIRLRNRQDRGTIRLVVTGSVEGGSGFGVDAEAGDALIRVDVTGTVTGTSDAGGGAVRVNNGAGRSLAEITIRGGLIDAGSGTAIWNGDGDAAVRMDGGRINGRILLGAGDDEFIWNGGNLRGITELDAGERAGNDRIRIVSDMSARDTERLLNIEGARNWDELSIESTATAVFLGSDNADITLSALRIKENATVSFSDGATDDRITMRGDLIGERGRLAMDVSFSGREADRLTLDGGTARGTTVISIVNPPGDVPSTDEGIVLVEVVGESVSKSAFELDAVSARRGLFANILTRETRSGGTAFTVKTTDQLGEFGTILKIAPALVRGAFKNLPKRAYDSAVAGGAGVAQSSQSLGGGGVRAPWLRVGGERLNIGASEQREEASSDIFRIEGGIDLMQVEGARGNWTLGVTAQHTALSGRATVDGGNGSLETRAFGIGARASWRGESDYYFDAAAHVTQAKSDVSTDGYGALLRDIKMDARVVGATAGRRMYAGSGIYVMPEVEIAYGQVSGDPFRTNVEFVGDFGSSNFFTLGFGARMELPTRNGSAYLSGSIIEDFADQSNVSAGGFDIAVEEDPTAVRLGFGGFRQVGEGARLMLEGTHVFSVGGDSGKRVSGGLSGGIRWDW